MATACSRVFTLPPRLAAITPCRITQKRSSVTPTSRTRITTVTGVPAQAVAGQLLAADVVGTEGVDLIATAAVPALSPAGR